MLETPQNGTKFGRWTITREVARRLDPKSGRSRRMFSVKCECGTTGVVSLNSLSVGNSQSCGCLHKEIIAISSFRHGDSRKQGEHAKEYDAWIAMKQRCFNKNGDRYRDYGGRGITVCKRWLGKNGYKHFLADVGRAPSPQHSLDRIDNGKNYQPSNVRWATRREQALNKRKVGELTHFTDQELRAELKRRLRQSRSLARPA